MNDKLQDVLIFNRTLVRRNRERAAEHFSKHSFLSERVFEDLTGRLHDVQRDFPTALLMGATSNAKPSSPDVGLCKIQNLVHMGLYRESKGMNDEGPSLIADEECLPFADESFDLVMSALNLHSVNDLPGALLQIRKALKPDGLFLAALLGGQTLHELRQALIQAEINIKGGASPRIAPFADKEQLGTLLQRAGFALPVVDSDTITVTYDNIFKLLHDLRGMGEGNALTDRSKTPPGKALFMEAAKLYQEQFAENDGRIPATFEIIFLTGWAPHESQQKPLRPGCADHSLAEALGSQP